MLLVCCEVVFSFMGFAVPVKRRATELTATTKGKYDDDNSYPEVDLPQPSYRFF